MIAGLVLAGGRSTRFGQEKATLQLGGRSMIARVVDVLDAGCSAIAVNTAHRTGAAKFATAHALPILPDAPGDPDGPLSGVKAGLVWARSIGAQALAVAPCDTPFLPLDLVEWLARARPLNGAAMAVTSEGPQPSCALWPVCALDVLFAALADGRHPAIAQVLVRLNCTPVLFEPAWRLHNLNTPDDHQMAIAHLAELPHA